MIKYNSEISRKIFHISSLWIPILYLYTTTKVMLIILLTLTMLAVIVEITRKLSFELNNLINSFIGSIMREKENNSFSGATYLLISASISVLFFSKEVAILALSILMISDSCAALIGRKFGKIAILDKTLEGSVSFFLSGVMVYYVLVLFCDLFLPFNIAMFAIFSTTIVELFSKKICLDDNLTIPLTIGAVFELVYLVS